MRSISVVPSAARLVSSLRDMGYDFVQAVADVVDNSVTAGARKIAIDLRFEGPDTWLRIVDDGCGMSACELTEAMRYGTRQSYDEENLGKFGLGLKTASLSQCRRLSVASRARSRTRIEVRQLDLDHVIESNQWEILAPAKRHVDDRLSSPLGRAEGTVVLWESLDRVLGYKLPWGERAKRAVGQLVDNLALHLGMVFHRFLDGEVPGRPKLKILLNGRQVASWDPFARSEQATLVLPASDFDLQTPEGFGLVRFSPYVVPARESFSNEEAFHSAAGPRKWNAQQGFYIYRANRMVQSGGWCRMRAPDEHMKLARAAIDFFPELDPIFQINVAKISTVLPAELKERLAKPVESLARAAQQAYRRSSDANVSNGRGRRSAAAIRGDLERAAREAGQMRALQKIVSELQRTAPETAAKMGWA